MRMKRKRGDRAVREAADWFTKLNGTSITTEEVLAFRRWREQPGNAAAFKAVDKTWGKMEAAATTPDVQSTLERLDRRGRSAGRRRRASIGALAGGVTVLVLALSAGVTAIVLKDQDVYTTAVGQQRVIALPDGSHVQLDTDSRFRVRYTADAREIDLMRGRALFDIAHATRRPLSVHVGPVLIRDLGTRFIVTDEPTHVGVTVLSGAVQVAKAASPSASRTLKPGETLSVTAEVGLPRAVDVASADSWTTGRLVFNDLSLTDVVSQMNRYTIRKVILAPTVGDAVQVSGTFSVGDPDRFAAAVTNLYDLTARAQANGDILIESKPRAPRSE